MNAKTGTLQLDWRPPQDLPLVPKGAITETNLGKILNRVTAREKPAGYYFFESDFLPARHPPRGRGRHAAGQAGDYLGRGQTQRRA